MPREVDRADDRLQVPEFAQDAAVDYEEIPGRDASGAAAAPHAVENRAASTPR